MMIEFLIDYGLFFAKVCTILVALLILLAITASASARIRQTEKKGHIEISDLKKSHEEIMCALQDATIQESDKNMKTKP